MSEDVTEPTPGGESRDTNPMLNRILEEVVGMRDSIVELRSEVSALDKKADALDQKVDALDVKMSRGFEEVYRELSRTRESFRDVLSLELQTLNARGDLHAKRIARLEDREQPTP